MLIRDRSTVSTRKKLDSGFLQVDATFSRVGIQQYTAGELGLTDRPAGTLIKVYRSPKQVFAADSLASLQMLPVTDNHPDDMVTTDNVDELAMGWSGDTVTHDGKVTKGRVTITKQSLIRKVDANQKVEISLGYTCDLDWTGGTTPEGETYDAEQINIVGNHIAVVDAGRCGSDCRLQDAEPQPVKDCSSGKCSCQGGAPMADKALKKIVVDGLGMVETTDEGETAIKHVQGQLTAAQDALAKKDGEIAAKDAANKTALEAKDKEIEELKAKVADTATLDARANARAKLIADAKKIGGDAIVTDGKTDLEIQKAAVTAKLGDEAVKDKPDTFFSGAFDTLVAMGASKATNDQDDTPERDGLRDALRPDAETRDAKKQPSYEDRMAARWKGAAA